MTENIFYIGTKTAEILLKLTNSWKYTWDKYENSWKSTKILNSWKCFVNTYLVQKVNKKVRTQLQATKNVNKQLAANQKKRELLVSRKKTNCWKWAKKFFEFIKPYCFNLSKCFFLKSMIVLSPFFAVAIGKFVKLGCFFFWWKMHFDNQKKVME